MCGEALWNHFNGPKLQLVTCTLKGERQRDKDRHKDTTGPRMQSTECGTAASHSWKLLGARREDCVYI